MRQRRLPIYMVILCAILAMVIFRLYCKGTYRPENRDTRDQTEESSKNNTVLKDKSQSQNKPGYPSDANRQTTKPGGQDLASRRQTDKSHDDASISNRDQGRSNRKSERSDEPTFNRNLSKITYSKHARCRMDCRRIDESEVLEIREDGKINYAKSELDSKRDPKFALEGITHDKQHVRIVFAQTPNTHVVVTCIDLDTDWSCRCN